MEAYLLYTTVSNRASAKKIVRVVLNRRLVACVHLAPMGQSYYWWNGKLEKAREMTLTFKTTKKCLSDLMRTLKEVHPYETPEILAIRVSDGDVTYLNWLTNETKKKS